MDTEKPVDLFEERIRREVSERGMNNFYAKIPGRDGIPMGWVWLIRAMVGENRQKFEEALATICSSTMMDTLGDDPDSEDIAIAMKNLTRYHSEMRVTQSKQEFAENVEVAIGRSGVDREALMQHLDSIPVRSAYSRLIGGILIACRDREDDIGCREASLAYLDLIESDEQLTGETLRFATEIRAALKVQDPDYPGMEELLMGLTGERMTEFMSSGKVNQELLLPVFIELRRMGYTAQDLRV